jgi:adenylate cyclase
MMARLRLSIGTEASLSADERRWRREARSAWLRLAVLAILAVSLMTGEHHGNPVVHATVVSAYALATSLALALALVRRGWSWLGTAFVVVDALAVVALLHEHLFGPAGTLEHILTTTNLAIAFVLLNHVALRLRPPLVLLYAGLVLFGWLSLLFIKGVSVDTVDARSLAAFTGDATLATAFAFAAFVAFLLTQDHNALLRSALRTERRRLSLSRFFSPNVVAELQAGTRPVGLERCMATVMFVDLRSFTRFAESASPGQLSEMLVDYRSHVARTVFDWGGTLDKFIGDGVMAVFGHPSPHPDDVERALRCALDLARVLAAWKARRDLAGLPALDAGIGLHFGPVVGGVLESEQYHEFTVVGDAVNVAERIERIAKSVDAALVVSASTLSRVPELARDARWVRKDNMQLAGRMGLMSVAYLPRERVGVMHANEKH